MKDRPYGWRVPPLTKWVSSHAPQRENPTQQLQQMRPKPQGTPIFPRCLIWSRVVSQVQRATSQINIRLWRRTRKPGVMNLMLIQINRDMFERQRRSLGCRPTRLGGTVRGVHSRPNSASGFQSIPWKLIHDWRGCFSNWYALQRTIVKEQMVWPVPGKTTYLCKAVTALWCYPSDNCHFLEQSNGKSTDASCHRFRCCPPAFVFDLTDCVNVNYSTYYLN